MRKVNKIMIIDDDVDDQIFLIEALQDLDASIKCLTASNGNKALESLQSSLDNLPDLIFLDLNMPRMSGKQFLTEIKRHQELSKISVVIYSTSSDKKDIDETARLGAANFITKPIGIAELRNKLKPVLSPELA